MEKKILGSTFFVCAIALLFPPWGWSGEIFERFSFLFSKSVPLSDYPDLSASIMWPTFGIEIGAILFVGFAIYFYVKD